MRLYKYYILRGMFEKKNCREIMHLNIKWLSFKDVACWEILVTQRAEKQMKSEVEAGSLYWAKWLHCSPGAFLPSLFTLFSVKLTALLFIRVSSLRMCECAHTHWGTRVSSYKPHIEDQETCFTGKMRTLLEIFTFWLVITNMRAVKTFILRLMTIKVRHMLKQVKQRDMCVQFNKDSDTKNIFYDL